MPPRPSSSGPAEQATAPGGSDDHLVLTDPRALRALAHPARAAAVDELYQGKVRTSSQLADLTGLTPSAMSYHLRALERWGIVVRADSPDARERPWRAAARGFSWAGTRASQAAADSVLGLYLDRLARDLATWRRAEPAADDPWHDTSLVNRGFPWLTSDELRAVNAQLNAILSPYVGRSSADRPAGSRRVAYLFATTPLVGDDQDDGA